MLLTIEEMDVLKLLWWGRCIARQSLLRVFPEVTLQSLLAVQLVKPLRGTEILTLSAQGKALLQSTGEALPYYTQLSYHAEAIERQLHQSELLLTAYRAGLAVDAVDLSALQKERTAFLPSVMRGRGCNPWSNSRAAALLRLGDLLCAAHYVCPDIGKLLLTDELNSFMSNTSILNAPHRALIFAGQTYTEVLSELDRPSDEPEGQLMSYADAYRRLRLPVHLLACDDTGALQLRLMCVPNYREKLTRAALRSQYEPPEADCFDATFQGAPFVMAADMELRRLERAIATARQLGQDPVALVCLEEQAKAVFDSRYRERELARVYILTEQTVREVLGDRSPLYTPPHRAYETTKGAVIDAPLIQTGRRTGKPRCK